MKVFLAACFAIISSSVFPQLKPYSYYVNSGLTDQKFYALSKDQYGRLLLATNKGVFSYNGFKSKAVDLSGLKSNEFTHLVEVGQVVYGLNKAKQLVEFSLGKTRVVNLPSSAEEIKWIKIVQEKLIVCTKTEVFKCTASPFQIETRFQVPFLDGGKNQILDFADYANESYVLLSSNELVSLKGKSAWTIPGKDMKYLVSGLDGLIAIPAYINKQNTFRFKNARFTNLNRLSQVVSKRIERVIQYNSKLFFCSEGSLLVYDLAVRKVTMHILGYAVQDVLQEDNGTIWVATLRKGLVCIPNGDYAVSTTNEFTSLGSISGVKSFVGIKNTGELIQFSQTGKEQGIVAGTTKIDAQHLIQMNPEQLLSGPYLIQNSGKWSGTVLIEHLKSIHPVSGGFLVGGSFGLRKYEVEKISEIGGRKAKFKTIIDDPITSIAQISDDEFLIANAEGLLQLHLSTNKINPVRYYNQKIDVVQIVEFQGKVLVLTASNEVLVYSGKQFTNERDLKEVNPDIKIQRLKTDGNYIYLLSDNTIYRYKGIGGEIERLEQLSTMNGLYLRDFVAIDSVVFVATQYGLFKFIWRKQIHAMPSFIVGKPYGNFPVDSSEQDICFTYKNSWIKIPFEVVELGESHPFVLQYRLIRNGDYADSSWINSSIQLSELSFEHLEGGKYRLELRLKDPYSLTYSKVSRRYFKVEYHWLEYKWIWFVFGVFSTLLISAYIRNRELKKRINKDVKA